jgi:hypothetical protein
VPWDGLVTEDMVLGLDHDPSAKAAWVKALNRQLLDTRDKGSSGEDNGGGEDIKSDGEKPCPEQERKRVYFAKDASRNYATGIHVVRGWGGVAAALATNPDEAWVVQEAVEPQVRAAGVMAESCRSEMMGVVNGWRTSVHKLDRGVS